MPSLTDLFAYADETFDDRLEFAEIIISGFNALKKAQRQKAETNDRIKKPRKH